MGTKNNSSLFYTCSLIEFMGRKVKRRRREIVDALGEKRVKRIYDYSDILHSEPNEKVAAEYIEEYRMTKGKFDNEFECKYQIRDYWTIGEVYERLIEDSYSDEKILQGIWEVYHSWIDDKLSDYNTDFYYQPRDYIAACYKKGEIL